MTIAKTRAYRLHPTIIEKLKRLAPEGNRTAFLEAQIMSAYDLEIEEKPDRIMRRFLWPDEVFEKLKSDAKKLGCSQIDLLDAIIQKETE